MFALSDEGEAMKRMTPKQRLALLDKMARYEGLAARAYQRYTWRPATETGKKELARYERNQEIADQCFNTLRAELVADVEAMCKT
jgi:hypothetical protein